MEPDAALQRSTRIEFLVPAEANRLRLDRFLAGELPKFSRSRLQQLIRDKFVRRNGRAARPRDLVRAGDVIDLIEPLPGKIDTQPEEIPLEILFEDVDMIVINKPAGLVVHPGAGHREHTLVNALLHLCPKLSGIGGKERPGIVHRLLVAGRMHRNAGVIEEKIGRHSIHRQRMSVQSARGRAARTDYRVLRVSEQGSLLECTLHSGRTHQIRVHLHHLGHPVLGDKLYAPKSNFPRQLLHAWKLGFRHPRTDAWKSFEAPLPADFVDAMKVIGG
jgi:23S rRNA pseudouridine1911/1915/1917 synthase